MGESMVDGSIVADPVALERQLKDPAVMSRGATPGDILATIASVGTAIRYHVQRPNDATFVVTQEIDDPATSPFTGSRTPTGGSASVTPAAAGRLTLTRTFRRQGKDFVLNEIRAEREERGPESRAVTVETMTYRKVKFNRNAAKDAERGKTPRPARSTMAPDEWTRSAILQPIDGEVPPEPPPAEPAPQTSTDDYCYGFLAPRRNVVESGTGQHLVVQHGFSESACLYRVGRTRRDLSATLRYDDDLMPTLDYGARIGDQAGALASTVNGVRTDGQSSIFVGYSNGGLVSRQVAQAQSANVRGVVTVSTPNGGIPVVQLGYAAVQVILTPMGYFMSPHKVLGPVIRFLGIGGDGRPVPVLGDVIAGGGTGYLNELNSRPEAFIRTGIVQRPSQRWLFRRVGATGGCSTSFDTPCGRRAVADMNNLYAHLRAVTVVHWTWNPFKLAARISRAAWAGAQMIAYNAIDGLFNFIVAPRVGDGSDGLVPTSSQRYRSPSTPDYDIVGADAHAEAYGSDLVTMQALRNVLQRPGYNVNPR